MRYFMDQIVTGDDFIILKKDFKKALEVLKLLAKTKPELGRVDTTQIILYSETLEDALNECRYGCKFDKDGNIQNVFFNGEKMGDDDTIFKTIAPFVQDGSFLEFKGEDNNHWRWVFKKGQMMEINPRTVWEEVEEDDEKNEELIEEERRDAIKSDILKNKCNSKRNEIVYSLTVEDVIDCLVENLEDEETGKSLKISADDVNNIIDNIKNGKLEMDWRDHINAFIDMYFIRKK